MNFELRMNNKLDRNQSHKSLQNSNNLKSKLETHKKQNNSSNNLNKNQIKSTNKNISFSRNGTNLNSTNSKNKIYNTFTGDIPNYIDHNHQNNSKINDNNEYDDFNNSKNGKFENSKNDLLNDLYNKSIMSRNTDRLKLKNYSSSMSCKNKDLEFKNELTRLHTEFDDNLKLLETSIKNIQHEGFDKYKSQIQEKINIKSVYVEKIDKLKQSLNYANSIKRKIGTKNTVYDQSTQLFSSQQKVSNYN